MVHYVNGNLLDSDCPIICHQVNCQGAMNSGVAKAIRTKWPEVYSEYKEKYDRAKDAASNNKEKLTTAATYLLGRIQCVQVYSQKESKIKEVVNMFAQETYGYNSALYTSYDAFMRCLWGIQVAYAPGATIGFPDHIGCCRGGANWKIIRTMIEEVLGEDYEVYIYKLEEN
jgi:O-acetyl-ADP-ribose deacetylase (regulator of RNase III)